MSRKSKSFELNDTSGKVVDIKELESRFCQESYVKPYQGSFFKRKIRPLFADNDEYFKVAFLLAAMRKRHKALAGASDIQWLARHFEVDSKTMRTFQTAFAQCADHRDEVKAERIIKRPLRIARPALKLK